MFMCKKFGESLIYTQRSMGIGNIFSGGAIGGFARWWANAFFQEWANGGVI